MGGGLFAVSASGAETSIEPVLSLRNVVEVAGRQGVASDGEFYYVSGSTALYKYDKSGNLVLEAKNPFEGLKQAANHIGDIDIYGGEVYAGIETFVDGVGKDIQIAVYDAETLTWKRSLPWNPASGQVEVCGLAVDAGHGRVWMADWVQGSHLYCYDLASGEYVGKVALKPSPKLQQGIFCDNGRVIISSDDGDAEKGEPDNLYVCDMYASGGADLPEAVDVSLYRTMSDFRRAGEIEGLCKDPSTGELVVLANRGARIKLGMPKGLYPGYDREIHEIYIYSDKGDGAVTTYYDGAMFPLYGKATQNTSERYTRLPQEFETVSRPPVWRLGRNSAGLYIRFRTNSSAVYARWESTFGNNMNHMTLTGTRGLDLYVNEGGHWNFAGSGRPLPGKNDMEACLIKNMKPEMREYMLYMSLYDGISSLSVGVDMQAEILGPAVDSPRAGNPIVFYGTSILQGGCANRPGMAFTSIIGRRLNRETVNLGFSGNALLDMEIAELMAGVETPALYVLDYVPNAYDYLIREKGEQFFRIIRDAHPDVPVIFLEDPIFPHSRLDQKMKEEIESKNKAQRELFYKLKRQGEKKIYFVSSEGEIGDDYEATVDGIHFTDLGMMRFVEHLLPYIKKAL